MVALTLIRSDSKTIDCLLLLCAEFCVRVDAYCATSERLQDYIYRIQFKIAIGMLSKSQASPQPPEHWEHKNALF